MTNPLTSRIALVTGASRGIGYATALALARAGAHVVALARTVGGLEELDDAVMAIGGSTTLVPVDVKDFDSFDRLAASLRKRYSRLDILVGNAAVLGPLSPLAHVEPKEWDDALTVNLTANFRLLRALDPLLRASDAGRVVFLTTTVATTPRAYWGPYAVTKAALEAMARTYAAETATTNVRVNLLNPGPTRTRMRATAMPGEDPMSLKTPDEVADRIVAMCLPSFNDSGRIFDFRAGKLLDHRPPA
jgi:NAD(P)-dependent dehydrogenase (short-subunit alcohol dehydrogenase family)